MFCSAPIYDIDVGTFGGKWRQNWHQNVTKPSWRHARASSYTIPEPRVRRHFLAPVSDAEIPAWYARNINPYTIRLFEVYHLWSYVQWRRVSKFTEWRYKCFLKSVDPLHSIEICLPVSNNLIQRFSYYVLVVFVLCIWYFSLNRPLAQKGPMHCCSNWLSIKNHLYSSNPL